MTNPTETRVVPLDLIRVTDEILAVAIDAWNENYPDDPDEVIGDLRTRYAAIDAAPAAPAPYQARVADWILACFGPDIGADKLERCDRLTEEALELVQAVGYSAERAHALVDYVFGREKGEIGQEVGGVMNTLAALCNACGIDLDHEAEKELARVWTKVEAIRAKQKTKPIGSALPIPAPAARAPEPVADDPEWIARASVSIADMVSDWYCGLERGAKDLPADLIYRRLSRFAPVAASPEAKPAPAVKALVWERGAVDWAKPMPGMKYVASATTPKGTWAWWMDGAKGAGSICQSEAEAKAAAQSDYDRRVRACLVDGEAGGWRPIEEAPKDGTALLLACVGWPPAVAASKPAPMKVGGWDTFSKSWMIFGASWESTHFMPLPSPPATGVE